MIQIPNKGNIEISIVIPVYNEVDSIEILSEKIDNVLGNGQFNYEVIYVDDGSTDGTYSLLKKVADNNQRFRIIQFRRNFGKAAAYSAGFKHAQGKIIITMDGDVQDDPAEIPKFRAKINEGFDMVTGWKYQGKGPFHKRLPSRLFNLITSSVTGIEINDFNCPFKAYRKEVLDDLNIYGELYRFIPVLAHSKGYSIAEIKVRNEPRLAGKSKYGFGRLFKGALDLITIILLTKFSNRPLHLFGICGIIMSGIGFTISFFLTILWFGGQRPIANRPLLLSGLFMLILGIQFIITGLLGELIIHSKISTNKDYYTIRRIIN